MHAHTHCCLELIPRIPLHCTDLVVSWHVLKKIFFLNITMIVSRHINQHPWKARPLRQSLILNFYFNVRHFRRCKYLQRNTTSEIFDRFLPWPDFRRVPNNHRAPNNQPAQLAVFNKRLSKWRRRGFNKATPLKSQTNLNVMLSLKRCSAGQIKSNKVNPFRKSTISTRPAIFTLLGLPDLLHGNERDASRLADTAHGA